MLLHARHFCLNALIVHFELFVELFGVSQVAFLLLESGAELLEVERVSELFLAGHYLRILDLKLVQLFFLLGLHD